MFNSEQDMTVITKLMNKAQDYFKKHNKTFVCGLYIKDRENNNKNIYYGNFIFTNAEIGDIETAAQDWQKAAFRATLNQSE